MHHQDSMPVTGFFFWTLIVYLVPSIIGSSYPAFYQFLLQLFSFFPNIKVFSNDSVLGILFFIISVSSEQSASLYLISIFLVVQVIFRSFFNHTIFHRHYFFFILLCNDSVLSGIYYSLENHVLNIVFNVMPLHFNILS